MTPLEVSSATSKPGSGTSPQEVFLRLMNDRRLNLGVVMDPIGQIKPYKDSTFAMLLAAAARGWPVYYMEQSDLYLDNGTAQASARRLEVRDQNQDWYTLAAAEQIELGGLDAILMRKDPPFDMEYIYTSYILERASLEGALVVNDPVSLRDVNEKVYLSWFPDCSPDTLITRSMPRLREFANRHREVVMKPLDGMGGRSIFVTERNDPNFSVIAETLTDYGSRYAMAQRYLPEIHESGDKRILIVDGNPVPYALARIPAKGEARGNLAAGGSSQGVPLTDRDRWICQRIGDTLRAKNLLFVGIDVIGDFMTEINVTSPTCIRELDSEFGLDIAGDLMDAIGNRVAAAAAK